MKRAFTLAETLIAITIIGVIASLTVPPIYNSVRIHERNAQLKTVYTDFSQAYLLATQDLGYYPRCGYWGAISNPYADAGWKIITHVNPTTGEKSWSWQNPDGNPGTPPGDWNGNFGDCKVLGEAILNRLNASEVCTGKAKDCLGYEYEGIDDALKSRTDLSSLDVVTQTSGTGGFRTSSINNSYYIRTGKGPIIVGYKGIGGKYFHPRIYAIDINGIKGPNRFGYDLHAFSTSYQQDGRSVNLGPSGNYYAFGGQTVSNILNNKTTDHKLNKK